MNVLSFFQVKSKWFYLLIAILGILNSLLYSGLLVFINNKVVGESLPFFPEYDWAFFLGTIVLAYVGNRVFQTMMIKLTIQTMYGFEMMILQRLKNSDFEKYEKLGKEKVFTAIQDSNTLSGLPEVFMNAFNSIIIVGCCLVYLMYTSIIGGLVIFGLMTLLFFVYMYRNTLLEKNLNLVRDLNNFYYKYLNDLLHGYREIKMSIRRNNTIYRDYLKKNREDSKEVNFKTSVRYLENELTGSYSWYLVLGFIIFVLPSISNIQANQVSAFIVTILYMIGPIAILITMIPNMTNVKIALERLTQFNEELKSSVELTGEDDDFAEISDDLDIDKIVFHEMVYDYFDERLQKTFTVGPVNLEINMREIIYIIGGNGSGKSTFLKLLVGLYYPKSGYITCNGVKLEPEDMTAFRDKMSAIFTDSIIFSENYNNFDLTRQNETLVDWVKTMKLDGKVLEDDEDFVRQLSKGQQKRLQMIYALLEEKQVLVLDEWAAEQDPAFRAYFYETLLPQLKQAGKTIILATHDDDFFHHADRIIKFNYGLVVEDQKLELPELEKAEVA